MRPKFCAVCTWNNQTEGGSMHSNIAEVPKSPQENAKHVPSRNEETWAGLIDRTCQIRHRVLYWVTSAHLALFWCSNNRIRLFSPCQNTCPRANFYAIENLELLRIFSRFIGFNANFFFYDYIISPFPAPLLTVRNSEQASWTPFGAMFTCVYYSRPLQQAPSSPKGVV